MSGKGNIVREIINRAGFPKAFCSIFFYLNLIPLRFYNPSGPRQVTGGET